MVLELTGFRKVLIPFVLDLLPLPLFLYCLLVQQRCDYMLYPQNHLLSLFIQLYVIQLVLLSNLSTLIQHYF